MVSKSRLCLKFRGKGGRKTFFSRDEDFFYREDERFQKSSLLEIWKEGGEVSIFFGPRIFFYRKDKRFQKSSLLEI